MELRHIRYFVAAAEELHFGRASEVLSVTRPAVSQTIADLELELGVKLFDRHAQKVSLTAAGETMLKHAKVILQDIAAAVQTTKRVGQGKQGTLTIGYGSLGLRHPMFREAVKKMGALYPDTDLILLELQSSLQIEDIRNGKLDAGFVWVAQDPSMHTISLPGSESISEFNSVLLEECGIGVAIPQDHRLAGSETLALADLSQEGFIIVGGSLVNPYFPFQPRIVQQVSNIAIQINLISVGMGVGLVVMSPSLQYPDDIQVIPLRDLSYRSQLRLVWPNDASEAILQNFVGIVRELLPAE
ncbi:LysR family transcriptional regulator [Celeribacter sp. PS-C1]|uniref:LysR family transcriptional regulator n=1 Tax=Celeribacter sp. PS-C1 TaxID=2820813 RepID=UPI001CA5B6BE|nr:LysR family transcriptional regulator [Celeribacter sp. PS-C1]MBW6418525.1 LysR family transcriptional regulator [Celeribacter sp. PS-C1]